MNYQDELWASIYDQYYGQNRAAARGGIREMECIRLVRPESF